MNKLIRIFIALLILSTLFAGYVTFQKSGKIREGVANFLPEDTLFFAQQLDGLNTLDAFKASKLGNALGDINVKGVENALSLSPALSHHIEKSIRYIREIHKNPLFHDLFDNHCVVAIFPQRSWSKPLRPFTEYIKHQSLLIARPPSVEEFFADLTSNSLGRYSQIDERPLKQNKVIKFSKRDEILSAAIVADYVLLSFEEEVIREALSIYRSPLLKTINDNPEFQYINSSFIDSTKRVYLDLDGFKRITSKLAENPGNVPELAILREISALSGFSTVGYGGWRDEKIYSDKVLIGLDRAKLAPLIYNLLAIEPEENNTLSYIVDDVTFYYWSNTLDIRLLWQMYNLAAQRQPDKGQNPSLPPLQRITGYDMDEILDMFGSDAGFLFRKSMRPQFVPIPDTALMIKLKDRDGVQNSINSAVRTLDIPIQEKTYKSIPYYSWGIYALESLQPVYTIYDDYLVIANTSDILRTIIDNIDGPNRLAGSVGLAPIDPGFEAMNNSICYIDQTTFLSHIREFVSWSGVLLALKDREAAAKSKVLIDKLIDPLLSGLTMYDKGALRTYIAGDWIVTEAKVKIED